MMALRLRTALAALTLLAASPALAVTDIVEGAPVSVLVEEELLSSDEREIPADGKIELRLPEGLPETALRLEDFSFDPRSGLLFFPLQPEIDQKPDGSIFYQDSFEPRLFRWDSQIHHRPVGRLRYRQHSSV